MTLNVQPILVYDNDALPYVLKLVNGLIHKVSPDFLAGIVNDYCSTSHKICFPPRLGNSQKRKRGVSDSNSKQLNLAFLTMVLKWY
jgi:hypothetical protein